MTNTPAGLAHQIQQTSTTEAKRVSQLQSFTDAQKKSLAYDLVKSEKKKKKEEANRFANELLQPLKNNYSVRKTNTDLSFLVDSHKGQGSMFDFLLPTSLIPDFNKAEDAEGNIWNGNHPDVIRHWQRTLFPDTQPTGRVGAIRLDQWLTEMMEKLREKHITSEDALGTMEGKLGYMKNCQKLFSVCMHEVVRQTSVQCLERGQLLAKVWVRFVDVFNAMAMLFQVEKDRHTSDEHKILLELENVRKNYVQTVNSLEKSMTDGARRFDLYQDTVGEKDNAIELLSKHLAETTKRLDEAERNGQQLKEHNQHLEEVNEHLRVRYEDTQQELTKQLDYIESIKPTVHKGTQCEHSLLEATHNKPTTEEGTQTDDPITVDNWVQVELLTVATVATDKEDDDVLSAASHDSLKFMKLKKRRGRRSSSVDTTNTVDSQATGKSFQSVLSAKAAAKKWLRKAIPSTASKTGSKPTKKKNSEIKLTAEHLKKVPVVKNKLKLDSSSSDSTSTQSGVEASTGENEIRLRWNAVLQFLGTNPLYEKWWAGNTKSEDTRKEMFVSLMKGSHTFSGWKKTNFTTFVNRVKEETQNMQLEKKNRFGTSDSLKKIEAGFNEWLATSAAIKKRHSTLPTDVEKLSAGLGTPTSREPTWFTRALSKTDSLKHDSTLSTVVSDKLDETTDDDLTTKERKEKREREKEERRKQRAAEREKRQKERRQRRKLEKQIAKEKERQRRIAEKKREEKALAGFSFGGDDDNDVSSPSSSESVSTKSSTSSNTSSSSSSGARKASSNPSPKKKKQGEKQPKKPVVSKKSNSKPPNTNDSSSASESSSSEDSIQQMAKEQTKKEAFEFFGLKQDNAYVGVPTYGKKKKKDIFEQFEEEEEDANAQRPASGQQGSGSPPSSVVEQPKKQKNKHTNKTQQQQQQEDPAATSPGAATSPPSTIPKKKKPKTKKAPVKPNGDQTENDVEEVGDEGQLDKELTHVNSWLTSVSTHGEESPSQNQTQTQKASKPTVPPKKKKVPKQKEEHRMIREEDAFGEGQSISSSHSGTAFNWDSFPISPAPDQPPKKKGTQERPWKSKPKRMKRNKEKNGGGKDNEVTDNETDNIANHASDKPHPPAEATTDESESPASPNEPEDYIIPPFEDSTTAPDEIDSKRAQRKRNKELTKARVSGKIVRPKGVKSKLAMELKRKPSSKLHAQDKGDAATGSPAYTEEEEEEEQEEQKPSKPKRKPLKKLNVSRVNEAPDVDADDTYEDDADEDQSDSGSMVPTGDVPNKATKRGQESGAAARRVNNQKASELSSSASFDKQKKTEGGKKQGKEELSSETNNNHSGHLQAMEPRIRKLSKREQYRPEGIATEEGGEDGSEGEGTPARNNRSTLSLLERKKTLGLASRSTKNKDKSKRQSELVAGAHDIGELLATGSDNEEPDNSDWEEKMKAKALERWKKQEKEQKDSKIRKESSSLYTPLELKKSRSKKSSGSGGSLMTDTPTHSIGESATAQQLDQLRHHNHKHRKSHPSSDTSASGSQKVQDRPRINPDIRASEQILGDPTAPVGWDEVHLSQDDLLRSVDINGRWYSDSGSPAVKPTTHRSNSMEQVFADESPEGGKLNIWDGPSPNADLPTRHVEFGAVLGSPPVKHEYRGTQPKVTREEYLAIREQQRIETHKTQQREIMQKREVDEQRLAQVKATLNTKTGPAKKEQHAVFFPEPYQSHLQKKAAQAYHPQEWSQSRFFKTLDELLDARSRYDDNKKGLEIRKNYILWLVHHFKNSFGMRNLAEKRMLDFFINCKLLENSHPRVALFMAYAHIGTLHLSWDSLNVYYVAQHALKSSAVLDRKLGEDGEILVNVMDFENVLQAEYYFLAPSVIKTLLTALRDVVSEVDRPIIDEANNAMNLIYVNVNSLVFAVAKKWSELGMTLWHPLAQIFGKMCPQGIMPQPVFLTVMKMIDIERELDTKAIQQLFSGDNKTNITYPIFLNLVQVHAASRATLPRVFTQLSKLKQLSDEQLFNWEELDAQNAHTTTTETDQNHIRAAGFTSGPSGAQPEKKGFAGMTTKHLGHKKVAPTANSSSLPFVKQLTEKMANQTGGTARTHTNAQDGTDLAHAPALESMMRWRTGQKK